MAEREERENTSTRSTAEILQEEKVALGLCSGERLDESTTSCVVPADGEHPGPLGCRGVVIDDGLVRGWIRYILYDLADEVGAQPAELLNAADPAATMRRLWSRRPAFGRSELDRDDDDENIREAVRRLKEMALPLEEPRGGQNRRREAILRKRAKQAESGEE